ncbi:MAG TPA: hypothetical protein VLJ39_21900 [Tepidisphaeraceae bacterium]|nr:hypothetical protein [Tepidisphaeraceae bacterium]
MKRSLLIFLWVLGMTSAARGVAVSRVLKTFDFEERRLGNEEDVPMNWSKVTGAGLPHYVNGKLATDRQRGGQYSFRFDLNGGGLVYRYGSHLIKVQQGAHYRVEGFCQTTALPNARARITAYLTDADGHVLEKTVRHSELYAAATDDHVWKPLSVMLTADTPKADSLVIELELLQPSQYLPDGAGKLLEQDIKGSVWWDDLTVSQVPAVSLRSTRPANIFRRGEPVRFSVTVSDRSTEDLVSHLKVVDAAGKEIYQRNGKPELFDTDPPSPMQKRMMLELPTLLPGWYEVGLSMTSQGQPLRSKTLNVVVLPDSGKPGRSDGRFGFVATDLPFDAWDELPQVLPLMSAGRVKLAVWTDQSDVEESHGVHFDQLLRDLSELGIAPTACLVSPPPRLAKLTGGKGWPRLLKLKPEQWQPDLAFLVSRHANHVDRWQLGSDDTDAFATDPSARQVYKAVYGAFSQLVSSPDLAMPWPAWYELSGDLPATVALNVPPTVLPSQLPLYIQDLRGKTDHQISLSLNPLERGRYGREVQIRDLAQRVIYALAADAHRIDLPLPIHVVSDDEGDTTQPDELFIIIRTMITTLSGAKYKGRVALGDGIEAFLFDREGQGIIALWSKADTAGTKELALNLGERPIAVDLWGNAAPLLRRRGDQRGRVSLAVGPLPMFLIDIDGFQAQLRASVALDQPLLESSFRPHERHIRFVNGYPNAITGTLHLIAPDGWTLNPPTFNFNLNPGETFDQPLTIQFPYNSFAGAKTLNCDFMIAGESNPTFSVPLTLRLGLSDVGTQTFALREGRDIYVQQEITNYGEHPISYTAFAMYPDQARQERLVLNLAPGATTVRRYRFTNVPTGQTVPVRVGLKELQGNRILNDSVDVR